MPYTSEELAKFARERYMRVAAIDIVTSAIIWNICVAREHENECDLMIIANEEVLYQIQLNLACESTFSIVRWKASHHLDVRK
jgi:hypothetical protein